MRKLAGVAILVLLVVLMVVMVGAGIWLFRKFLSNKKESYVDNFVEGWRYGNFKNYKSYVINYEKFEEMLFLNSLMGRVSLRCYVEESRLICDGFSPILVKVFPKSLRIEWEIYLSDTSTSIVKKHQNLPDWKSKVAGLSYFEALQVCNRQIRNYSEIDSLYLEKMCIESEIKFWESVKNLKANEKFLKFLLQRNGSGYSCIDKGRFMTAERIFDRTVKYRKIRVQDAVKNRVEALKIYYKVVSEKLSKKLGESHDPLAEAFYKRGLEYVARGDYKSAKIYFEKALKVEPTHKKAKEALERVRRALGEK